MKTLKNLIENAEAKNLDFQLFEKMVSVKYRKNMIAWYKIITDYSNEISYVQISYISSEMTGKTVANYETLENVNQIIFN